MKKRIVRIFLHAGKEPCPACKAAKSLFWRLRGCGVKVFLHSIKTKSGMAEMFAIPDLIRRPLPAVCIFNGLADTLPTKRWEGTVPSIEEVLEAL